MSMEPSASIPAASPGGSPFMTPQLERPEQGKFSIEETEFLKTHLPAYGALCQQLGEESTGSRGTGLVKGRKKDWILSKVFPEFVKQFSSNQKGGPQLQSLQAKLLRWFLNRSPHRNPGSGTTTATPRTTSTRPRATNGASLFAEEHKAKITERMAELQDQEGGIPKQVNFTRYHTIKRELYDQLTDEERHIYDGKAAKKNEACKAQPDASEIFKNQEGIVVEVVKALNNLIGWDWGQCGEAAFFVQGAYRNADSDLETFNVSIGPNAKITSFSSTLPEYKNVLRAPFREWAGNSLPVYSPLLQGGADIADAQNATVIDLQGEGPPLLPIVDVNVVAPNNARLMLKAYIELTWNFATTKSATIPGSNLVTVPWDSLDSVSLRRELLLNPGPFLHVKTLDPIRMSPHEVYSVLALLLQAQNSGVRLLEFSIGAVLKNGVNSPRDNVTTELNNDSHVQTPRPEKCTADSELCTASARDNSTYNNADLKSLESPLPLLSVPAPPPVIDQPQLPPLSESMIKVAIKNVAEAGYLSVSDASVMDKHLKTASQECGEATTSDPNSMKHEREEMERDVPKQMKKHRAKVAVPTREQSSRLKDANYKNRHVTVRPR